MTSLGAGRQAAKLLGALGMACCLALAAVPAARAQDAAAVQALIDRQAVEDLLTRYAWNLGVGTPESYAAFYAEDATLMLGASTYTGREAIRGAYAAIPRTGPSRMAYSFNVVVGNPLVVVTGDTATARMIFTEVVIDEQGDAPRLLQQGREFDTLVKVDGQWLIQSRQIVGGRDVPDGWTD